MFDQQDKRRILFTSCIDSLNAYAELRSVAVIQPSFDEERVEDIMNILRLMQSFVNSDLLSIQEEGKYLPYIVTFSEYLSTII